MTISRRDLKIKVIGQGPDGGSNQDHFMTTSSAGKSKTIVYYTALLKIGDDQNQHWPNWLLTVTVGYGTGNGCWCFGVTKLIEIFT